MKNKIGQIVSVKEDFEIKTVFGNESILVKKGDEGFIDSKGCIHYNTGKAKGKIQAVKDSEMEGYAHDDIAKLIFERLDLNYDLREVIQDYDLSEEDFIDDIEDALIDIL